MLRCRTLIVLSGLMMFAQSSNADEVIFKNGDRLTGKIVHLVDGKLVFKSSVAGDVTVNLSDIESFSSDEAIEVNLKDNTGFKQKVLSAETGRFGIEGAESLKAQEFAIDDIVSINPPIKPAPKWTGDVAAGLTSTHGNTKTEMISANANLSKRTENDRTQLTADYAKGKREDQVTGIDETIEDWWRAKGKYDYFFGKKFYTYVDGRYEKDDVAQLDRRVIIGGGGGYQWIESENMKFSTELGLASLYEKFDNQTESNSELSTQLGYNFDKKLTKHTKLTHDLTYYPTIQKFSDYFLTSTAGIRADFSKSFFVNFKTIFNYDETPAIGSQKTDVKYFMGLGYSF
jgi:putative salt-induced outer membrane protein YdiY